MSNNQISTANKKLTGRQWTNIEKQDLYLREVSCMMSTFGKNYANNTYKEVGVIKKNFSIDGDIYKDVIRNMFIDKFGKYMPDFMTILVEKKKKNNKKKKHGSGQQLVREIRYNKLKDFVVKDLDLMNNSSHKYPATGSFECYESILLNIMLWCLKIISYYNRKGKYNKYRYDASLSIIRAINDFSKIDTISPILIGDANKIYQLVISYKEPLSVELLQKKYPNLITETTYDRSKINNMKPYSDQIEVTDIIKKYIKKDKSCLIRYQTPPSSGKTTLVLALTNLVNIMSNGTKQVLYTCYNNFVRTEVSKMLFQSNIEFAIISNGKCTPHYSCYYNRSTPHEDRKEFDDITKRINYEMDKMKKRCDKYPKILICDLISTKAILSMNNSKDNYISYIDEPTAGSEKGYNYMTDCYTDIMLLSPKISVFLSATIPEFSEIDNIVNHLKITNNMGDNDLYSIKSSKILVNCLAIDKNGFIKAPHQLAKNNEELKNIITILKKNYFLQRFYTSYNFYDICSNLDSIPDKFKEENLYTSLLDINHSNIRNKCMELLEYIVSLNNDLLIQKLQISKEKMTDVGFDPNTACTTSAYQNLGSNLYIRKSPEKFLSYTKDFLKDSPRIKNMIKKYNSSKTQYEKECNKIEKGDKIKGSDNVSKNISSLDNPIINWDNQYVINSRIHLEKHAPEYDYFNETKYLKGSIINDISIDEIEMLPDDFDKALFSGVGIHNPNLKMLDSYDGLYNDVVLSLADNNKLSYIVSDESITYGTNLPIKKVIIDDCDTSYTQNMLHQLIGRAGRTGKSNMAEVVFMNDDILVKTFNTQEENTEAIIINSTAQKKILQ